MKRLFFLLTIFVVSASCYGTTLTPEETAKHVGEMVEVVGVVSGAKETRGALFLNFGGAYPHHVFTAFLMKRESGDLLDGGGGTAWLLALKGKRVWIFGKIKLYNGKPEIQLFERADVKELQ